MGVSSVFDMRFPVKASQEGFSPSLAIAADMLATQGCTGSHVIRDLNDFNHMAISTCWSGRGEGEVVPRTYPTEPKLVRVTELLGHQPMGFLRDITDASR